MSTRVRTIAGWVLTVMLAAAFAMAGLGKLTGAATEMFANWGYPAWFATFIGGAELAGAVGLLVPKTRFLAAIGLTLVMFGAVYTHLANGEGSQVLRPLIFLAALWMAWWLRRMAGRNHEANPA